MKIKWSRGRYGRQIMNILSEIHLTYIHEKQFFFLLILIFHLQFTYFTSIRDAMLCDRFREMLDVMDVISLS